MKSPIPFNRVKFEFNELDYISQAVESGHISGNGPFCKRAEALLSDMHGGSGVLLTPSCSHALELAARLIGFEPGDEVIVPSYTFVTTVSSFVLAGATPVFCDIHPDTLGLDPEKARELITPRTKAICIVHYAGVPAHPEEFVKLAEEFGLVLVEDNAHGLGGVSGGRTLGTFGSMSTLSFHETKNITCGEGGALVINDPKYVERAEILREKGTDRSRFFRGQVDKYTWVDVGSSWVISEILAAVLVAQLENFDSIQSRRGSITHAYLAELAEWASQSRVRIGPTGQHTSHMSYAIFQDGGIRDGFLTHVKSKGIGAVFHYQPLHSSEVGQKFHEQGRALPVTEEVAERLARLPLHSGMELGDVSYVVEAVKSSLQKPSERKISPRHLP